VTAVITNEVVLNVFVEFASHKHGVIGHPFVRYVFVGDEMMQSGAEYGDLRSMRRQLMSVKNAMVRFDPIDGDFQLPADGPGSFEGVTEVMIVTSDYNAKGMIVPVTKYGDVSVGGDTFKMRGIWFDGKRLAFGTETLNDVSFRFEGRYLDLKVDSHGAYTGDTALNGRMVKFVKGKKVSEAELTFHYVSYPGC
jgi:hypothetical protein